MSGRWLRYAGAASVVLMGLSWYAMTHRDRLLGFLLRLDPEMRAAPHFTDPDRAGDDYAVQGEYTADGAPWALQVVALGKERFEATLLAGGLPGAGARTPAAGRLEGNRQGTAVHLSGQGTSATLRDGIAELVAPDGSVHLLPRVERRSPTLGSPPPPGALVLFGDGDAPHRFDGTVDHAGHLVAGAESRDVFEDFRLHLEFRTPFEPTLERQKRGNSGVYIQRRYEVQILDSFGREGADDDCGAIYRQKRPDHNMALPPLTWQTYDIDFTAARFDAQGKRVAAARITVRHNGVLIHDDVALVGPTGLGEEENPTPGPLFFQDHGNPVRFRNVWILPSTPPTTPRAAAATPPGVGSPGGHPCVVVASASTRPAYAC